MNGFGAEWFGDIFILCNTTLKMALLLHKTALSPKLRSQTVYFFKASTPRIYLLRVEMETNYLYLKKGLITLTTQLDFPKAVPLRLGLLRAYLLIFCLMTKSSMKFSKVYHFAQGHQKVLVAEKVTNFLKYKGGFCQKVKKGQICFH